MLLALTASLASSATAQEAVGGEASAPVPARTAVEPVDQASLMPVLYFLTAVVGGVALLMTVLLAIGMGDLSQRKELSEGERRLTRMLGKSKTEFKEGREKTPEAEDEA
jgi:hypothetical protein